MTEQYLNEETLKSFTPNDYGDFKVLSADSYSDTEMWKAIEHLAESSERWLDRPRRVEGGLS